MSAAVLQPPALFVPEPGRKYTSDEVERILESGAFGGVRFELLDGELIDKMGQSPSHATTIRKMLKWLASVFGIGLIRVQLPVIAGAPDRKLSTPEPDLAVTSEEKPDFARRHPRGDELLLAVEVADTSVRTDTRFKRDLYARAGVPEYWVLDINSRRIVVHRKLIEGAYAEIVTQGENDTLTFGAHSTLAANLLP